MQGRYNLRPRSRSAAASTDNRRSLPVENPQSGMESHLNPYRTGNGNVDFLTSTSLQYENTQDRSVQGKWQCYYQWMAH